MIPDETNPPFSEKPKEVSTTHTTVETKTTGGRPRSDETSILGASGRFWITLSLTLGLIAIALVGGMGLAPDMNAFVNIFTSYIGVAGIGIGTYLGQKQNTQSR